jgi:hypothetical protein
MRCRDRSKLDEHRVCQYSFARGPRFFGRTFDPLTHRPEGLDGFEDDPGCLFLEASNAGVTGNHKTQGCKIRQEGAKDK